MTTLTSASAKLIAQQNDQFRHAILILRPTSALPGRVVLTRSLASKPWANTAIAMTAAFAEFTLDNDPEGHHDFGSFQVHDERVFFKIDYFEDEDMEYGSPDPSDPGQTFRVLTIMLASDW